MGAVNELVAAIVRVERLDEELPCLIVVHHDDGSVSTAVGSREEAGDMARGAGLFNLAFVPTPLGLPMQVWTREVD